MYRYMEMTKSYFRWFAIKTDDVHIHWQWNIHIHWQWNIWHFETSAIFLAYNSSTSNQNARLLLNLNLATQSYTTRITLATTHFISILINGNAIHTPRVASTCMDTLHWILLPVPLPDQYGLVMWSRDESASWSTISNEEINQLPKSMSTIPTSNYAQFTVCYKFVTSN